MMSNFSISCSPAVPSRGGETVAVTVTSDTKDLINMSYTAQNNNGSADTPNPTGGCVTPQNGQPAVVNVEISPSGGNVFVAGNVNGVFTATGTYQGETQTASTNY
jgi:hypothetical protein